MANKRDDLREIAYNTSEKYADILARRNLKFVQQYVSREITYPTDEQISNLLIRKHLWTVGDRYWKMAAEQYGDPALWWILAWFNSKPTEAHVRVGDIIYIPHPLDKVYSYFEA